MGYDVQQVCLKGHQITGGLFQYKNGKDFCPTCGEKTISKCQKCNTDIDGDFVHPIEGRGSAPPNNCHKCGAPFPWTIYKNSTVGKILEPYPPIGLKIINSVGRRRIPTVDKSKDFNIGRILALWILFFLLLFLAVYYFMENNWFVTGLFGTGASGLFIALVTRRL